MFLSFPHYLLVSEQPLYLYSKENAFYTQAFSGFLPWKKPQNVIFISCLHSLEREVSIIHILQKTEAKSTQEPLCNIASTGMRQLLTVAVYIKYNGLYSHGIKSEFMNKSLSSPLMIACESERSLSFNK